MSPMQRTAVRAAKEAAEGSATQGPIKEGTANTVVEALRPIQDRFAALETHLAETSSQLRLDAGKAWAMAAVTLERARAYIGPQASRRINGR